MSTAKNHVSTAETTVLSLLLQWHERRVRGDASPLDELCRDHPEIAGEIRRRARVLEHLEPLAGATAPPGQHAGASSATTPTAFAGPEFLAPPQSDDELGRLGKYRILSILGRGGMGVVFKAEDPVLRRIVAIKVLRPMLAASASAGQRFLREAQAMAAVEHDHIVRIYQVDEERGLPFLAMELLKGESLHERLKREERLPLPEVVRVGREVAEALAAAHATGLTHRDVKPANVWLEAPKGRVKILDFGLARAASQDAALTQEGAIIGTPAYMAPEQARGEAVDARCDLFSLGCVLYRMITGQQPFQGKDTVSTLLAVASHQPAPPVRLDPGVPQEVSDLVMRLLEKEADRRPASAAAVVETLQAVERELAERGESSGGPATLPTRSVKPAAPRDRRLVSPAVAAVFLLGGLLGMGAFTLIRIQGDQGDYVIDTDDPDFSFRVSKGAATLEDRQTGRKYDLKVLRQDKATGESELEVTDADAGLSFKTKTFTVKRGERVALKAWFEGRQATAAKGSVDEEWLKQVAAMPAEKQVEAVEAKFKELNPGFDGKVTHRAEDGVVTELRFSSEPGNGHLADLTPLRGMNLAGLKILHLGETQVSDAGLEHFEGCKSLTHLHLHGTQVSDAGLEHFKGCKSLTHLDLNGTQVSDAGLEHFKGCKSLTHLSLAGTRVGDAGLTFFNNCKNLTLLHLAGTQVSDAGLALFKDCKNLTHLYLSGTEVSDLSPLKGMKLTILTCDGTQVSDLSPLKGMPLKELHCDFRPERDAEILRSIETLETINGKPVNEFWKEVDGRKP
jgi:serine/threonine protein kinase